MAQQSRTGYIRSSLRPLAGGILTRTGLEHLSFGAPRLWPARTIHDPAPLLAQALRPYRRQLWRQRSGCVLVRLTCIGLAVVLLLNLVALAWRIDLPVSVRGAPLVLCLAAGVWLAIAQRPTAIEVAQLLDRRYRLREALVTAVEMSGNSTSGPLYEQQIALALAQLQQLSDHPWSIPRRGEHSMLIVLVVAAAGTLLLAPAAAQSTLQATSRSAGAHSSSHSPALVAQAVPAHRPLVFPAMRSDQQPTSSAASGHRVPTLAMSLQVRIGPQVAMTGSDSAPGFLTGGLGGGTGTSGGQRSGAAGSKGSVQSHNGGAQNSAGGGSGGQGGSSTGQGQDGAPSQQGGDQNGGQGPQNGPQSNPGQSGGSQGAAGNGQDPTTGLPPAGQGNRTPPQNPAQTNGNSGQPGANPFGQDQNGTSQGNSLGNAAAGNGSQTTRGQGTGTPNGKPAAGTNGHSATGDSNQAGNQDDLLNRRHGTGATTPDPSKTARPGQAGPATGQRVNLGGSFVLGKGVGSPQLVRVLPLGAAPGGGMDGSSSVGSPIVQGYVPEDATSLGPDDQAMVRAYFSGETN